ncbi:hypothetical protein [Methanohalophilus profundi]|uniref:hypothetical protein n=1 Tax=Methanohalophilus profundi TaxID=2138083 RepID=UPI0013ED2695|nr:hypothetical protein [Methanohalophilus profundi]
MDEDKSVKVTNVETGKTKSYTLPKHDKTSQTTSLIYAIESFMQGIIYKECR